MINLHAGLNRYLQSPPHSRIINLMHHDAFQNANAVFTGVLRDNKEKGFDVSRTKSAIAPADMKKLYKDYFLPGVAAQDPLVLQQKVFFDLVYFTSQCGKEGLRELKKEHFELKKTAEGVEYFEIIINKTTKKNQGDDCSSGNNCLHNNENVFFAQPGSPRCPVLSFKQYLQKLNSKLPDLFQHANVKKNRYDAAPVGINTLGNMMAVISQ